MRLIIRWLIVTLSLMTAVQLVPGITITSDRAFLALLAMGLIVGLINAVVRPILVFLSCPLMALTLGLFIFVINAFLLWFAGWLAEALGIGFHVDGFAAAFFGALIVSLVSTIANIFVPDDD